MISMLLAVLVGCRGPQPSSIRLDGEPAKVVHNADRVPLNAATVLDEKGSALAEQPAVTWTVSPGGVAKLDGSTVVPLANGEATITAAVGDVTAEYHVVVQLPDRIAVIGYKPGDPWPVGDAKALAATVESGEVVIDDASITWVSDRPAVATVDETGSVLGVTAGTATVTAASGTLTATVVVTIQPAAKTPGEGRVLHESSTPLGHGFREVHRSQVNPPGHWEGVGHFSFVYFGETQLCRCSASEFYISPSGAHAIFTNARTGALSLFSRRGQKITSLTDKFLATVVDVEWQESAEKAVVSFRQYTPGKPTPDPLVVRLDRGP